MYITTDEPKRDFNQVTAVEDESTDLQLFDYVLIQGSGGSWIGQITAPNINISTNGGPYDPAILYAIKLKQSKPDVQLAETIESWQINLLGQYEDGRLRTLRRRPKPSASVFRLDRETTIRVLKLPAHNQQLNNVVGYLLNAEDVPFCVSREIFTHHILVSGGTGSGKSNTGANLIRQAAKQKFTVFLYDAKPDYRKMKQPNTDQAVTHIWPDFEKYTLAPCSPEKLTRIAIYGVGKAGITKDYTGCDAVIGFRTSDFDPYLLAALFFDEKADNNQYEEFASVCADLKYAKGAQDERMFSMDDVLAEVEQRKQNHLENERNKDKKPNPSLKVMHHKTADTIIYKVRRNTQNMPWLDAVDQKIKVREEVPDNGLFENAFNRERTDQKAVISFKAKDFVNKGGIVHIDCSGLKERTYALFLSRFLNLNKEHLADNPDDRSRGVVEFVDEAHRLFTNDSRYSDLLGSTFSLTMVEGRSQGHGVILSLQNASQVPSMILNNVNSHIVMRQNNRMVAKAATQTMGDEYADHSVTLSSGEALCRMFESSATVLVRMAPSPFELERSDNAGN